MAKTIESSEDITEPSLQETREKVKLDAELQGIPVTNAILTASADELKEMEELTKKVKEIGNDAKVIMESLKSLKLPSVSSINLNNLSEVGSVALGSANLFDEYIINVAKKSYDNLKKIKADKESTNFDFFKGCVQLAADMFFAIKTFCKKVKEKYPIVLAAELTFAVSLAPVYTAIGVVSTALSICGYSDKTAELIVGGKELRAEAKKAAGEKKALEKEQGDVSVEVLFEAYKKLEKNTALDEVVKFATDSKTIVEIANVLDKSSELERNQGVSFLKQITEVHAEIPKSKEEISTFVQNIVLNAEDLSESQKGMLDNLKTNLEKIKEDISAPERIALTAIALQKFNGNIKKNELETSKPFNDIMQKLSASLPAKENDVIAKTIGCDRAFTHAVTSLAKSINLDSRQISY